MNLSVGWVEQVKSNNQKPRYCWVTLRSNATCFMPGNPFGSCSWGKPTPVVCDGKPVYNAPLPKTTLPHHRSGSPTYIYFYISRVIKKGYACPLSPVTCHLSPVTCHLSPVPCSLIVTITIGLDKTFNLTTGNIGLTIRADFDFINNIKHSFFTN